MISFAPMCAHEAQAGICTWCRRLPLYLGPHWDANFLGTCCICFVPISVGERIRWATDGLRTQHSRHK